MVATADACLPPTTIYRLSTLKDRVKTMEEGKKVSFGFSKLPKKTVIVGKQSTGQGTVRKKIEYIDCLEGKSIKIRE